MYKKLHKTLNLAIAAGVIALASGCATTTFTQEDLDALSSRVGELELKTNTADFNAAKAKEIALEAQETANNAQETADSAVACCDANTQKLNRMFQKSQTK